MTLPPFALSTYEEDQAIILWEGIDWGWLDTFAHAKLWTLFESWLARLSLDSFLSSDIIHL
jgi:hypothetical protein